MDEVLDRMMESDVILSDLDDNLIDQRAGNAAFGLILDEFKQGHYYNAVMGTLEGLRVYATTYLRKAFNIRADAEDIGLIGVHSAMSKAKIKKQKVYEIGLKFIDKHKMDGAKECMNILRKDFGKPKKLIIVTKSSSVFTYPAIKYFEAENYLSNESLYNDDDTIKGVRITMGTPKIRLEMAEKKVGEYNKRLEDCIFITNNDSDDIFKGHVKVLVSSPKSKNLKSVSDMHISSYREFERKLTNYVI